MEITLSIIEQEVIKFLKENNLSMNFLKKIGDNTYLLDDQIITEANLAEIDKYLKSKYMETTVKEYYVPALEELHQGFNFQWKYKTSEEWLDGSVNVHMLSDYHSYDFRVEKLHCDHLPAYGFRKLADEQIDYEVAQFFMENARLNQGKCYFFANVVLSMQPDSGYSRVIIANGSVNPAFIMFNGIIKNNNQLTDVFYMLGLVKPPVYEG